MSAQRSSGQRDSNHQVLVLGVVGSARRQKPASEVTAPSSKLQTQMARLSGMSPRQMRAWATANRAQLMELGRRFAIRSALAREAQVRARRVEEEMSATRRKLLEENVRIDLFVM